MGEIMEQEDGIGGGASQRVQSSHNTATNGYAWSGSGGGATDIRIGSTSTYARVIVAGGGGGAGRYDGHAPGVGGGTSGTDGIDASISVQAGHGGTQTAGGSGQISGSFGQGGASYYNGDSGNPYISGGGGGWYGRRFWLYWRIGRRSYGWTEVPVMY